tara:strand:- start:5580 stop:6125 length:546 start_codon:yes stop_codon:yes gene_type:complete
MAFNVNEIRSQLTLGGARNSLFQVRINNPANSAGDLKVPFLVKATQIPASTLGVIEVPYFGRKMKIAGDRLFAPWQVTVINDEDFLIRNSLEEWMGEINKHAENTRGFGSAGPDGYKKDATVTQFSKTGVPIREYKFVGIYPAELAEIDLNWEAVDQIQEFQCIFQYDYWTVSGATGNAGT